MIIVITVIIIKERRVHVANLKYSRQREAIKEYLYSTPLHPTADTVYMYVKQEFPNISLGTVYRNLNLLADLGEAAKLTTPDGAVRFDCRIEPHYHFYCRNCGKLIDMDFDIADVQDLNELASRNFDGCIESYNILFYGTCVDCINKS